MLLKFTSVLDFSKYHDCNRRTEVLVLFFVFSEAMLSLKVFISSSVYVTIDPDISSVFASPSRLVELNLPFSGPCSRDFLPFSLSRAKEVFFMPLQEFVVQFKTRKNLRLTLENAFVCF